MLVDVAPGLGVRHRAWVDARALIEDHGGGKTLLRVGTHLRPTTFGVLGALLIAGVIALMPYVDGRLAALAIAGAFLLIALVAAAIGWRHHVSKPLARTRKTVEEDVQWAKKQLA